MLKKIGFMPMICIEGENCIIESVNNPNGYDTRIYVRIYESDENGAVPKEVVDYISAGNHVDKLILRNDQPMSYDLFIKYSDRIKSLSLHGKYVDWNSLFRNSFVSAAMIKQMDVIRYGEKDLSTFKDMTSLEDLVIYGSRKLSTLHGAPCAKKMQSLRLEANSVLDDINGIAEFATLKELKLVNNKRLYDYTPIKKLHSLESLTLVGESDSLSWLKNMVNLKELRLDCKLEDKNLDFLYEMPSLCEIRLRNKRGQSVKEDEIKRYLENKGGNI